MSAVLKPGARPYGRDFRPLPALVPDLAVDLAELKGWKVGRNFFPGAADKTSDEGDREHAIVCDEIRTRQWRELDATTVGDVACDERLAAALRAGAEPRVVGNILIGLMNERIEGFVRSEPKAEGGAA